MYEISIVGARNSGKTTLVAWLVTELTARGWRVATIKHTGDAHTFDKAGKDSYRHRRAGAAVTAAISSTELAVFAEPDDGVTDDILRFLTKRCEWCLTEGDKSSARPKVLITENLEALGDNMPQNVIATVGIRPLNGTLPHFGRDERADLLNFLLNTFVGSVAGEAHAVC